MQQFLLSCPYDPQPIFRLQNSPLFSFIDKLYSFAQFSLQDKVRNFSMTFLRSLSTTRFPEVPHGGGMRVFHKLVKCSTIPQVQSEKNALLYFCVIVNALGMLEDNRLKNYHPLSVPLPSTDPVKFYRQDSHKSLPNFPGRCVIALGQNTKTISHRACHLLSSAIPPSKWSPGFWCTQSW